MARAAKKLFYKIGEVCELCDLEPHVLRYWESEFSRLKPAKNRAGQRIYRKEDLELIETIKVLLYEDGYTIAGANQKLMEGGQDLPLFDGTVQVKHRRALKEINAELEGILRILDGKPD